MFVWDKVIEKGLDLTGFILKLIDKATFTEQEKKEKKEKIMSLGLNKIKIESSVLNNALGLADSDAKSGNKYQSYARPSIIWLFILLIIFSYIIAAFS